MIIKHYNNSFFLTKIKNTKLVCDPWIGALESTGTWSYPNTYNNKNILNTINPDIIYISHLHNDHFDKEILKKFLKKKTKIIIKKFKDQRLKGMIEKIGYKNIVELNPWEKFNYKEFELTIIPCDQSNSAGIKSEIFYDIDTSIIIHDKINAITFYNNVDNPISLKSIRKVKKFITSNYKKIDVSSIGPRSASEYPQCFLNANRKKEKKRIILNGFKRTKELLEILKPKYFIPAGGSYVTYGKYSSIQQFVAHPSHNQIEKYFKKIPDLRVLKLDCNSSVNINLNKFSLNQKKQKKTITQVLNDFKNKKYSYSKYKLNYDLSELFSAAKQNYFDTLNKLNITINWTINFYIYENLCLNNQGRIINKDNYISTFALSGNRKGKKFQILNCYLDKKLFISLLSGKSYGWNLSLGGSLVMFERFPNRFIPTVPFSLNFLKKSR